MAWTDTVHKFLAHLKYNATLPTYTDGQTAEGQCDSRGRLVVTVGGVTGVPTSSTAGTTWYTSFAETNAGTIVGSSKALLSAYSTSAHATAGYIQFFNLASHASLVHLTSVPLFSFPVAATTGSTKLELSRGRLFSTGIVWAFSLNQFVYDQEPTAICTMVAEYI